MVENDLKTSKEEKGKLDDEIRKIHKEKSEEKEKNLKLKEEKIKLQS